MAQARLFLASRDPGATNQMKAVDWLARNPNQRARCSVFSELLFGSGFFAPVETHIYAEGAGVRKWEQEVGLLHDGLDFKTLMKDLRISHLVTGLDDVDAKSTRQLWAAARDLGIPVICVVDNDINIAIRCVDAMGKVFIPDKLYLRSETSENLPQENLVVGRDIYHLYFADHFKEDRSLRTVWGADQAQTVVTFISQNGAEMLKLGRSTPYCEFKQLDKLLGYLRSGLLPDGTLVEDPLLVIRLHPRDTPTKYDHYVGAESFKVILDVAGTTEQVISSSDVLVGMRTAMLEEAGIIGKRVIDILCKVPFSNNQVR